MKGEDLIQAQVVKYLTMYHKDVLWFTDPLANVRLNMGQIAKAKALGFHGGRADLEINEPVGTYHGLYIDIKDNDKSPYKKDGEFKAQYLNEYEKTKRGLKPNSRRRQLDSLCQLNKRGYVALYATGFDECVKAIESYLEGSIEKATEVHYPTEEHKKSNLFILKIL